MQYNLIVSLCLNNGIGFKNQIPWHITNDLRYFSKLTKGDGLNAVIMGNKTWQSLPVIHNKPRGLAERDNFVLASNSSFDMLIGHDRLVKTFKNIADLEAYVTENATYEEIWVIGGAEIYKQFLEMDKIKNCYVTFIDKEFECDTFFPIDIMHAEAEGWTEMERTEAYDTTYECLVCYCVLTKKGAQPLRGQAPFNPH
jgi:dihydrofolate reductase